MYGGETTIQQEGLERIVDDTQLSACKKLGVSAQPKKFKHQCMSKIVANHTEENNTRVNVRQNGSTQT